jgi:hypothetical protein
MRAPIRNVHRSGITRRRASRSAMADTLVPGGKVDKDLFVHKAAVRRVTSRLPAPDPTARPPPAARRRTTGGDAGNAFTYRKTQNRGQPARVSMREARPSRKSCKITAAAAASSRALRLAPVSFAHGQGRLRLMARQAVPYWRVSRSGPVRYRSARRELTGGWVCSLSSPFRRAVGGPTTISPIWSAFSRFGSSERRPH